MSSFTSIDNLISLDSSYGVLRRAIMDKVAGTTAANTTSGYVSMARYPNPFTIPSLGGGVTGAYLTMGHMLNGGAGLQTVCFLEVTLGTLTVSGNSFSAGSSMPSRSVQGSASVQLASVIPVVVATATMTATTPTLTITYTDQDGNTGQTCTMTLPTNAAVNSAFRMTPHLASGDTGVRAVTNMSISTGSAGTVKCFGLMPLAISTNLSTTVASCMFINPMTGPFPLIELQGSDVLSFYKFNNSAMDLLAFIALTPDN